MESKILRDRIITLCLRLGMSPSDVYKQMNMSKLTWSRKLTGKSEFSKDEQLQLAQILKVDTLVIFREKHKCLSHY